MVIISRHFLPHFFSFAIESYIYETDLTLDLCLCPTWQPLPPLLGGGGSFLICRILPTFPWSEWTNPCYISLHNHSFCGMDYFFLQFCCRFSFPAKTTFFANLSFYANNPDNFNKWVYLLFEIWKHLSRIHQFVLGLTNSTQIDSYLLRAGAIMIESMCWHISIFYPIQPLSSHVNPVKREA